MDIVIFVKSCARDRERGIHGAIRETWGAWGECADIRFVLGRDAIEPFADELVLDAGDGWDYLWEKTREANLWAVNQGYKWAFHACTDTYVVVPRLVALTQTCALPYIGSACPDGHLSGGAGYLLNWEAMNRLADAKWYADFEDKEVHDLLDGGRGIIRPHSLPIFRGAEPKPWDMETVSVHLGTHTGSLTQQMLYACDRRFVEAFGDHC